MSALREVLFVLAAWAAIAGVWLWTALTARTLRERGWAPAPRWAAAWAGGCLLAIAVAAALEALLWWRWGPRTAPAWRPPASPATRTPPC